MSDGTLDIENLPQDFLGSGSTSSPRPHPAAGYAAAIGFVVLAAMIAFVVETIIPSSNIALVFVLPVLLAAINFGWGPALVSALAAVAAFDFFFIQPIYTLRVASPSDLWAMSLLLIVAAIASTVAAQSRRRALDAQAAASRAEALHRLAHLVVDAAPAQTVCKAASEALAQIFEAPAVVLLERGDQLDAVALARGAVLSSSDEEAARWTLANTIPTRGEAYPFDTAAFDFWPIRRGAGQGVVLGVRLTTGRGDRPSDPARYVEMVGAYLAAGLSEAPRAKPAGA